MTVICQSHPAQNTAPPAGSSPGTDQSDRTARIRQLNDQLRQNFRGGRILYTPGITGQDKLTFTAILSAVACFTDFTAANDPYAEHDCAVLEVAGLSVMFKIDYYDTSLLFGSPDPADPDLTVRVMTVLLAEEY